jgi:hypothetical protein
MKIEHKVPKTKAEAIKFAKKEIKEWYKFLNKLQMQLNCPCCHADIPPKLPKNWGKLK